MGIGMGTIRVLKIFFFALMIIFIYCCRIVFLAENNCLPATTLLQFLMQK